MTVESGYAKAAETATIPLHSDLLVPLRELHKDRRPRADAKVFVPVQQTWKSWRTALQSACDRAKLKDFRSMTFAIASDRGWRRTGPISRRGWN